MILVDQADALTKLHQIDLRSKLEGHGRSPGVVWVFTADSADNLDRGFRSRCEELKFSSYGFATDLAVQLELIWESETSNSAGIKPNFVRMIKEANGNMLLALNRLETVLR